MNEAENNKPSISVNAQYIKDLSFENLGAPYMFNMKGAPQVDVGLDVKIKMLSNENNEFEVSLNINASASYESKKIFILELEYAGIFTMNNFNNADTLRASLGISCPTIIFPFARRIVSDVTKEAGYQALTIDPIDFATLYQKRVFKDSNKNSEVVNSNKDTSSNTH